MESEEYSDLLAAIAEAAPKWQARGEEIERTERLPQDMLEWVYDHRLFKMMVPSEMGGRPLSLPQMVRVIDELSATDGNLGWLVQIGAGAGYFVPSFAKETAAALFSPREAVIAGSGHPVGRARRVEGGYVVTGQWRYASGAQYASLFTVVAVCDDDEKPRAFAFLPEQVQVIHDWRAFGLKATTSDTISAEEAFVPDERVFIVGRITWNVPDPIAEALYRVPFDLLAVTAIGAVSIGLTRRFFDLAQGMPHWEKLDDGPRRVLEAARGRERFHWLCERAWTKIAAGVNLEDAEKQRIIHQAQQIVNASVKAVQRTFPYLGMRVLWETEPINRVFRDLLTASHHAALRRRAGSPLVGNGAQGGG